MKKEISIGIGIFLLLLIGGMSIFVKINRTSPNNNTVENRKEQSSQEEQEPIQTTENIIENENISKEKINIYLFWGDGCPHCENLIAFLENLNEEYKSLYTLHTYEVWHNKENKELMQEFNNVLNQNITSVPFLIIGNKTFVGYTTAKEENIKNAIKDEYNNENRTDYLKEYRK